MEQVALAAPGGDISLIDLFMQAGWVVKLVMIGLILASVWTWAIIIEKSLSFRRMRAALDRFEDNFWSGQSLEELYRTLSDRRNSGMAAIFVSAMREWKKSFERGARSAAPLQSRIDKSMDLALAREMEGLESRLGFLATIGSAAPFIGLFGTVVGIMTSFQAIAASKQTSLAVVAPGIAEALLATAIGLVAAIPAVMAYNKLSGDANKLGGRMEGFADEFSAILSRQIDERSAANRSAPQAAA
ncbi:protein TolQ [Notoacmeibacter marinus]|uniref:Tol-Pal system protein TolQ n=1 Tax=Notoacmeibacter marinus TaxID=1876515 RepID=A0A231V349_9HYPH|nr:protein TolQ [Notoacmeibacter marinus]OXT02612.1 protein TolQ [Notoacmeibacter marinus]